MKSCVTSNTCTYLGPQCDTSEGESKERTNQQTNTTKSNKEKNSRSNKNSSQSIKAITFYDKMQDLIMYGTSN